MVARDFVLPPCLMVRLPDNDVFVVKLESRALFRHGSGASPFSSDDEDNSSLSSQISNPRLSRATTHQIRSIAAAMSPFACTPESPSGPPPTPATTLPLDSIPILAVMADGMPVAMLVHAPWSPPACTPTPARKLVRSTAPRPMLALPAPPSPAPLPPPLSPPHSPPVLHEPPLPVVVADPAPDLPPEPTHECLARRISRRAKMAANSGVKARRSTRLAEIEPPNYSSMTAKAMRSKRPLNCFQGSLGRPCPRSSLRYGWTHRRVGPRSCLARGSRGHCYCLRCSAGGGG